MSTQSRKLVFARTGCWSQCMAKRLILFQFGAAFDDPTFGNITPVDRDRPVKYVEYTRSKYSISLYGSVSLQSSRITPSTPCPAFLTYMNAMKTVGAVHTPSTCAVAQWKRKARMELGSRPPTSIGQPRQRHEQRFPLRHIANISKHDTLSRSCEGCHFFPY
ncbi:hypothetical protein BAUCODRAFT_227173 [Baudoinia panamericana UAMH 10762]|uniref:Uncharacterized protein n=1 Tax=Baudoinia panamericana (strain UAMH 10762) TaxID=717646 RepID=M2LJ59_BAUPA|nr:uncharacterized protein BAUCODRAFT_227173 [Baudoinia panamericana UAMH 10762]EMC94262.1 hypothetical protein BAUCODRAFT_227173 [Baudoinia panamericana UAMH 10762]